MSFEGSIAVVTGAASGIGEALARELAGRGAGVVLVDRDAERVRLVAGDLAKSGASARPVALDVREPSALRGLVDECIERHGRLDYLFNNAGIATAGELRDHERAEVDEVLDVNLRAVVHGTRMALRAMADHGGGHIVNTASIAGLAPLLGGAIYAATKHGVVGLSLSARVEGAACGVRVSVVCPGLVQSRIFESVRLVGIGELPPLIFPMLDTEKAARRILRGVARNRAVIITPGWWRIFWLLARLSPSLTMFIARRAFNQLRRLRIDP